MSGRPDRRNKAAFSLKFLRRSVDETLEKMGQYILFDKCMRRENLALMETCPKAELRYCAQGVKNVRPRRLKRKSEEREE